MGYELPNIDGQMSEWNEAMFKMMRLHRIQTEINVVKMNPLSKYEDGQYNYVVWFNLLKNLYDEGKAKYKVKELEEVDKIKETIELLMERCPAHVIRYGVGYGSSRARSIINLDNWKVIKGMLELFETKIKLYNDLHGLSTKNSESMDGRSILR